MIKNTKRVIYKYEVGNIINGHKIISKVSKNSLLVECGNCGSLITKDKSNLLKTPRCIKCKRGNSKAKRHIATLCWILGLNEFVVRSRITRGMSVNEALYFEKGRNVIESFRLEDRRYIVKDLEEHYEEDKAMAEKAYLKYRTTIKGNIKNH